MQEPRAASRVAGAVVVGVSAAVLAAAHFPWVEGAAVVAGSLVLVVGLGALSWAVGRGRGRPAR